MAIAQHRLYNETGLDARDAVLVQQHTVFVELIASEFDTDRNLKKFAAVVGLVKTCKRPRTVFDNAVLWFNDQFLFGNKTNITRNITDDDAMGINPNRTIALADILDDNRNNGTGRWNASTNDAEVNETGTGPNQGGNPDRDGFIRARDLRERWAGCFIPNGFVHAIGADDPYGIGNWTYADAHINATVAGQNLTFEERIEGTPHGVGAWWAEHDPNPQLGHNIETNLTYPEQPDNIELVQQLIDLDHECRGCLFRYVGSFYVTDPNNHRWIVDKLMYPNPMSSRAVAEPLYTVHVQVDPWNPDRQGFPDEAIWKYREDNTLRLGLPYAEDPSAPTYELCKGNATTTDRAVEFDLLEGEGGPYTRHNNTTAPGNGSQAWGEFRRGNVGATVECAIEYNFLIAIDFGAFDNTRGNGRAHAVPKGNGTLGLWANWSYLGGPEEGTGEDEVLSGYKQHGDGQADQADKSWQGNSHPHNPKRCRRIVENETIYPYCPWIDEENRTWEPDPPHRHDAISLDLFFYHRAPHFVEQNPYWDHANNTDALTTTGTPPVMQPACRDTLGLPSDDYRRQSIRERRVLVCDVDAMDGFHLHDGTQTIP